MDYRPTGRPNRRRRDRLGGVIIFVHVHSSISQSLSSSLGNLLSASGLFSHETKLSNLSPPPYLCRELGLHRLHLCRIFELKVYNGSEMILASIEALNDKNGSKKSAILKHIEVTYNELLAAHFHLSFISVRQIHRLAGF